MTVTLDAGKSSASLVVTWDAADPANKSQRLGGVSWQILLSPTNSVHSIAQRDLKTVATTGYTTTISSVEVGVTYTATVRAVKDDGTTTDLGTSDGCLMAPFEPSGTWRLTSWIVVGAFAVTALIMALIGAGKYGDPGYYYIYFDLAIAFAAIAVILLLLTVTNSDSFGVWRMIIGTDRRVSTSYSITALWTFLVAFALAYFAARSWLFVTTPKLFDGINPGNTAGSAVWDNYLILLGGPFAALVLARGIVGGKMNNGTMQKTISDDGSTSISQALTDDSGNIDLVDSQYVIFNIVAFIYVLIGLSATNQLPAIPGLLLALTGSSAATYVLNKSLQNSTPTIGAPVPSFSRVGDVVSISGTNLRPDASGLPPTVTIGGVQAIVDAASATDTRISVTVAPGTPEGMQTLQVTTSARIDVSGKIDILSDQPVISSVSPPGGITQKSNITIYGVAFYSQFDPGRTVTVAFRSPPAAAPESKEANVESAAGGKQRIKVAVPDAVAAGDATVTVTTSSVKTSEPFSVTIKAS
jgi:hypothetical protein